MKTLATLQALISQVQQENACSVEEFVNGDRNYKPVLTFMGMNGVKNF